MLCGGHAGTLWSGDKKKKKNVFPEFVLSSGGLDGSEVTTVLHTGQQVSWGLCRRFAKDNAPTESRSLDPDLWVYTLQTLTSGLFKIIFTL